MLTKAQYCADGSRGHTPATLEFSLFRNTALAVTASGLCLCCPFRLKCPLMPSPSSPGADSCSSLKAELRSPDRMTPSLFVCGSNQQEFVPSIKASLQTLCHLGRCLPRWLGGESSRAVHVLIHPCASHNQLANRRTWFSASSVPMADYIPNH